jgi:hypothetical protein
VLHSVTSLSQAPSLKLTGRLSARDRLVRRSHVDREFFWISKTFELIGARGSQMSTVLQSVKVQDRLTGTQT